jgi:hypothetical protein
MDTKHVESKAPEVETAPSPLGKENFSTYLHLVEGATEAIFAWQNEVLKFADVHLSANIKLYEHISNVAVQYSQRVQDILRTDSEDTQNSGPPLDAKQNLDKRQNVAS